MMITAPSRREDSTEAGKEIYKAKRLSDQNVGMGRDGGSIYKKDRGRGYEEDGTEAALGLGRLMSGSFVVVSALNGGDDSGETRDEKGGRGVPERSTSQRCS
jgi:hypothetical protein